MSDPQKYRTKEEVEEYKKQDPIESVKETILKHKWASEAELDAMDEAVRKEVEEAVLFAEESPMATEVELYNDVYSQKDYPFEKD